MIRKAILTLGMLAVASAGYAQSKNPCATDEFYREQKAIYPGIEAREAQLKADIDRYLSGRMNQANAKTTHHDGTPTWPTDVQKFHIPVVVHVISDNAPTVPFITDNDIYGMIDRLNQYYNGTNPGIPNGIIAPFRPYIGSANISFHLATKDPAGKATRGITRQFSQHAAGGDELAKINGWAPDQYLNIWLINVIGRTQPGGVVLAYATFPTSHDDNPYSQGVISRADQALPNPSTGDVTTLAHEVGHYLSLYHTWNSNGAGVEAGPCGDDEVDDTPPTFGHFSCSNAKLYDTLCATGYHKNYDSVTFFHMTDRYLPTVITSNDSINATVLYNDSTATGIGQSFTTGADAAFLTTIAVRVGAGANSGGAVRMSLYNATGSTLIARSANAPSIISGATLSFDFTGVALAANTTYKFELDSVGGYRKFALATNNANSYGGGQMFTGAGANTPVAGSDLYFVIKRQFRMDYPDTTNTQNIMDYSACPTQMFTKGQVARMRATLRSSVGFRSNLVDTANLIKTGVWDASYNFVPAPDVAPIAEFSVNRNFVCADGNTNVLFTNRSYNDTATIEWKFDKGASQPTSASNTLNNTFTEPGWVTVELTANSNAGSNTLTRSDIVYAADPVAKNPIGYFQDFNPGGDLDQYPIFNYFKNNHKWELVNNAGYYDKTSIRFANYETRIPNNANMGESPRGSYADFYTPAFDLTNFGNICNLSFYSAGAFRTTKPSEMNDNLEIAMSTDCGLTWRVLDSLKGGRIGNNGFRNDNFTPTWMGEWREQSVPITSRGNQTFFRFRFKPGVQNPGLAIYGSFPYWSFGTGNNFYLDRITISNAPLNVKNGVIVKLGMSVAPNPTSGAATVSLNGGDNSVAEMTVTDVTGKLVYSSSVIRTSAVTKVEIPATAIAVKGMYLVKVVTNGATETQKLVVY